MPLRLVLVWVITFSATLSEAQTPLYNIQFIGTLGGRSSTPTAINDSGQIVGWSYITGNSTEHAFLTAPNGGALTDLTLANPALGFSIAWDVNSSGQVAGYSFQTGFGFVTGPNGSSPASIGSFGGNASAAHGINADGQVVGYARIIGNTADHGFFLAPGQAMKDLGTFGGNWNDPGGVNDLGQVTGNSSTAGEAEYHAYLSAPNGGVLKDLGTIGGTRSSGSDVNNFGQVAGNTQITNGSTIQHAFLSGPNGGALADLGVVPGFIQSSANAVNDMAQVVGEVSNPGQFAHPFLYTLTGGMQDLNTLVAAPAGFTLNTAADINNVGQIVGYGQDGNGNIRGYMLTPITAVPEPATVSAAVLLALFLFRREIIRRSCKKAKRLCQPLSRSALPFVCGFCPPELADR